MKRLVVKSLGAVVAIALAGVAMAVVWGVATTQGSRWLLETVVPLSGTSFSAQKIEGSISSHLLLTGVRVGQAHQKLEFDTLELRWKPLLLLAGTVAVQDLTLNGVRIQDNTPPDNKPPVLVWPRVPGSAQLFDGKIAHLLVTDLSYRYLQEQPARVTYMAGSLTWQDNLLSGSGLKIVSPFGQINGTVSAGFKQASLTADLVIAPVQPLGEMDHFSVQVRRGSGQGAEQLAGAIAIAGASGTRKLLELGGEVGMARNAFNLRRLRLTSPGQRGLVSADGTLAFTAGEPLLSLQVRAADLDLAPMLNVPTDLSGTLKFAGTLDSYRGDFNLANRAQGWQAAVVSAVFQGTRAGLQLAPVKASFLDGLLSGNLAVNWHDGFALQGALSGRQLNPARLSPDWQGVANFNATGKLARLGNGPVTGSVSGALLESSLHGQALTGEMQADFVGNSLSLNRLVLQGKGFDLHAAGELNQRLDLSAQISDFSRLVPGAAGTLQADGWLRRRVGQFSGAVAGRGSQLSYGGTRIAAATLSARLDQGPGNPAHIAATFKDVIHDGYGVQAATLAADGTLARHTVNATLRSGGSEARLTLAAGYKAGVWEGELSRLAGKDDNGPWSLAAPAAFAVGAGKIFLAPLALRAGARERLEVAADLALTPLSGQVRAQWDGLSLARANPYLKDVRLTGSSHGTVRLGFLSEQRLSLTGSATGSGTFTGAGHSIALQSSTLTFDGGEQGLRADIKLSTTDGGSLKGTFSSTAPLRMTMPEKGELTAELSGIDLALLKPWLPTDTRLEGRISARAKGGMLPGQRFELDGNAVLSGGRLHQSRPDGELNLVFKSATASWGWRGETLTGDLALTMAEHGQGKASFQLPVEARFPVAVNSRGGLRASITGQFQEKGIITALFPGLVQESSGALEAELTVSGTWEAPLMGGSLRLSKAGAYLPSAGIHLKDVQLAARLEKNLIRIDAFRAASGPGHIEGTALITLSGGRVTGYQGSLRGENFQTIHFPELRLSSSPRLTFEGTPQKLKLRGELRLPELDIVGAPSRTVVVPSSDVVLEGRGVPVVKGPTLALDVQVRVLLGERVNVKVAGVEAQLGGAMDLSLGSLDRITSKGEINVIKGRYRTYGVNLEIVRGRLFFAGGSIDRPALDFLALRTIGDVRAGVTVAGTLQQPVTKLYSEPAMPDVDILAYIVLGHPLGSSGEQASLVARAAGALLTSSQASVLGDQIKNHLGLSTLEVHGGVGGTKSPMGYKPLPVTPLGALPAAKQPGLTETVFTVGKYLTPQLYISYGKSLFTGNNLFRLRYDIYKQWQIETQTGGGESGADLYYKLEFK